MKNKCFIVLAACLLAFPALAGGKNASSSGFIVPGDVPIKGKYQFQKNGGNSWTTGATTLTGATTESMMQNQIGARHPGYDIRILAAEIKSPHRTNVRYQFKSRNGTSWTSGSMTLTGALTESMTRNQLMARHPRYDIRILGMNTLK